MGATTAFPNFLSLKGGGGIRGRGLFERGLLTRGFTVPNFFIVRLWEAGWKGRYYQNKFHITENEEGYDDFRKKVVTF